MIHFVYENCDLTFCGKDSWKALITDNASLVECPKCLVTLDKNSSFAEEIPLKLE